jgi:hypothetical protein
MFLLDQIARHVSQELRGWRGVRPEELIEQQNTHWSW